MNFPNPYKTADNEISLGDNIGGGLGLNDGYRQPRASFNAIQPIPNIGLKQLKSMTSRPSTPQLPNFTPESTKSNPTGNNLAAIGADIALSGLNMAKFGQKRVGNAERSGYGFDGLKAGFSASASVGFADFGASAAIGAGFDAVKYIMGNNEFKSQLYADKTANRRNMKSSDVNNRDYMYLARKGGVIKAKADIPVTVEGKEIGIIKVQDGWEEVFRTGENTKDHEEGGKKVKVPDGTEIFNEQLFDQVDQALKNKDWETIENTLIPQRDKILSEAKAQGDPYSTGLTSEEAAQVDAQNQMFRGGGKAKEKRLKIINVKKFDPARFRLKNQSNNKFSGDLQPPMNESMFNKGAFNNSSNRFIMARKGGSIRRPVNMNNMAASKIRMKRFSRSARNGASVTGGEPGVPDGIPYTLFNGNMSPLTPPQSTIKPYSDGGNFYGVLKRPWSSIAPTTPNVQPQNGTQNTSFENLDNKHYVNSNTEGGTPSFVRKAVNSIKTTGGKVLSRANEIADGLSMYDKASLYSVGAAGFNALQPLPRYQSMKRLSLDRFQFDDTANKLGEANIAQQAQQAQSGFSRTVKGVGSLMGTTAAINKNTIEGLNTLSAQRNQGIMATANANAQIAGQEKTANVEIANQETLTNEQLRAQSEQLKAQSVKANLDSAIGSQFQERQYNIQKEAVDKQAEIQKASLAYMANTDKFYQEYNSSDASKSALEMANKDYELFGNKIGNTIDSFLTLQPTDDETKKLVEKRDLALSEFNKKDPSKAIYDETSKAFESYRNFFDELGKFERGEIDKFNGLSKEADADTQKEQLTKFSEAATSTLLGNLKKLRYSDSEIKLMEQGEGDKKVYSFADEKAFNEFKNRLRKEYVSKAVYEPEIQNKKNSLMGNLSTYKKEYLKSKGIFEPDVNYLLSVIK